MNIKFGIFLSLLPVIVKCFNVDSQHTYFSFNKGSNTHFGFAVALQKANTLLIGAPLGNFSGNLEGAVYRCTVDNNNNCNIISVRADYLNSEPKPRRHNQRMGMTFIKVKENVLTCAPRWNDRQLNIKGYYNLWFRGRCSSLTSDLKVEYTHDPCEYDIMGNKDNGYCVAGLSATGIMYNGLPFYIVGLPGAKDEKGILSVISRNQNFKSSIDQLSDISSLMGYSVSWGNFDNSELGEVAGGAPRANDLKGLVIIYRIERKTSTFSILTKLESPSHSIGTYFGGSVCAVDLDNDGNDDLLVGAPMYSKVRDEGRMYIYMRRKGEKFVGFDLQSETIDGESKVGAKFATTIVKVGDINGDGYNDIAVGAPFGGNGEADNKGAVYIYNGGSTGLHKAYSQVIYASTLRGAPAGFGVSISTGLDVDANTYPDFAVGAYLNDTVFLFKTRPIVTLSDNLQTNVSFVPPEMKNSNCNGPDGEKYYCIEFQFNLQYSGKGSPNTFDLEISLDLDPVRIIKRAYLLTASNTLTYSMKRNVTLEKGKLQKIPVIVYFDLELGTDVETPIVFTTHYKAYEKLGGCGAEICPVVDLYGKVSSSLEISYLKRCGADSTCNTDLVLKSAVVFPNHPTEERILHGAVYEVNVQANVTNLGEPAYQARIQMNFTSDLEVIGVDINGRPYVLWQLKKLNLKTHQLLFPIANPVQGGGNETVRVIVKFSVTKLRPSAKYYTFSTLVISSGQEDNHHDNSKIHSIETKIQSCIRVQGDARPPQITYENNKLQPPRINATVEDIGQEVVYAIYVQNAGKSPVSTLLADVEIVAKKGQYNFMYIVDMRVDSVQCSKDMLNSLNYSIPNQPFSQPSSVVGKTRNRRDTGAVNCRSGKCKTYSCEISNIDPGKGATIIIMARLWEANIAQMALPLSNIETVVNIKLTGPDRADYVQKEGCNMNTMIKLELSPSKKEEESKSVSWWVILLCVVGALIVLAIAAALLYKIGFFKRDRKIKQISGPEQEKHANPDDDDDDDDDD
ncbi:integrin alpha-V-like [Hydractinia symbiolongicarpus]|uniref:integrin alpha-V-like n=1 Tax=Hydractinia symbiolongicarpus TaxID=13093 RepID=UPI00254B359C|nr:integrin alpha-V-like [Hydractinia symbiolongicarpus]